MKALPKLIFEARLYYRFSHFEFIQGQRYNMNTDRNLNSRHDLIKKY